MGETWGCCNADGDDDGTPRGRLRASSSIGLENTMVLCPIEPTATGKAGTCCKVAMVVIMAFQRERNFEWRNESKERSDKFKRTLVQILREFYEQNARLSERLSFVRIL